MIKKNFQDHIKIFVEIQRVNVPNFKLCNMLSDFYEIKVLKVYKPDLGLILYAHCFLLLKKCKHD